jgi:hypothetical protein
MKSGHEQRVKRVAVSLRWHVEALQQTLAFIWFLNMNSNLALWTQIKNRVFCNISCLFEK